MSEHWSLLAGDILDRIPDLDAESFDAVLCDPPYHLTSRVGTDRGFMGQTWDGGDIAHRPETWKAVSRVLKPGGYLLVFGGTRTWHRMAVAMEDAGLILVDTLMWVYGNGFPKSMDISKGIDKHLKKERVVVGKRKHPTLKNTSLLEEPANAAHGGNAWMREWDITRPGSAEAALWAGYGTALKPAWEPILLFRKPGEKTYAENALKWSCGALNIDACRVPLAADHGEDPRLGGVGTCGTEKAAGNMVEGGYAEALTTSSPLGRWPANLIHDGSEEVLSCFPDAPGQQGDLRNHSQNRRSPNGISGSMGPAVDSIPRKEAATTAARFFYCPKVSTKERHAGLSEPGPLTKHGGTLRKMENATANGTGGGNHHPTLKPIDLCRYLAALVLSPKMSDSADPRRLLVPFSGSGSEMIGGLIAGFDQVVGIEASQEYIAIAQKRLRHWVCLTKCAAQAS